MVHQKQAVDSGVCRIPGERLGTVAEHGVEITHQNNRDVAVLTDPGHHIEDLAQGRDLGVGQTILADELAELTDNLEICTDDGSAGFHGFVTDRLQQLIDGDGPGRPDFVVAIGPMPMMRAQADMAMAESAPQTYNAGEIRF